MTTKITVNGVTYTSAHVNGDITINDNGVFINGAPVDDFSTIPQKEISVTVEGTVNSIETHTGDIQVLGDICGNVKSMSGDISVHGGITGSVSTMSGDISR